MSQKHNTHIQKTFAEGFVWEVVFDGKIFKSGVAKTQVGAISAAERAAQELGAEEKN